MTNELAFLGMGCLWYDFHYFPRNRGNLVTKVGDESNHRIINLARFEEATSRQKFVRKS